MLSLKDHIEELKGSMQLFPGSQEMMRIVHSGQLQVGSDHFTTGWRSGSIPVCSLHRNSHPLKYLGTCSCLIGMIVSRVSTSPCKNLDQNLDPMQMCIIVYHGHGGHEHASAYLGAFIRFLPSSRLFQIGPVRLAKIVHTN